MATLLLRRPDVARHLQALRLLPALREALEAGLAAGPAPAPGPARVAQGALPGIPATCVTVEAGPGRTVLQLHQAGSGALLAVMEAGHLRTLGAAVLGALAADALARPDAAEVAVLGEGARASSALKALRVGDGGGGLPGWALPLDAELGAVLAGRTTGRTSAAQLTLFATAGTAALDLVAAWQVYQGALGDEGVARLELDERAG